MTKLLLKNKLKIVLSLMLFAALVPMQSIAQKKVLFICNSAFSPAVDASSSTADPLIAALSTDSRFAVTIITTADGITSVQKNGVADATALEVGGVPANTSPATIASFYANYDLVVTQESFGGTTAIWKSAGLFGIKNITIPVIYTKLFALQNTRALTDVANTPTGNVTTTIPAGNKLGVTVDPANQTNPLFTGVTFTANEVKLFKAGASDTGLSTGTTAIKAVDMGFNANITDITTGDLANQKITTLGYLTTANTPTVSTVTTNPVAPATVNPNSTLCINDVPGGTYFGTAGDMLPTTSRMILLSFNYGATVMGYGATTPVSNFTDDGIKIFKNAALILTNQPLATNENSLASDSVSVSPNPTSGVVNVNSTSAVKAITVFDTTGKQVATSKTNTVDLSSQAKGVYLVNVKTENGATTKKVVVE